MYIRQIQMSDANSLFKLLQNSEKVLYYKWHHTVESMPEVEELIKKIENSDIELVFSICSDDNEFVGITNINYIEEEEGLAEFSIIVDPQVMGKGYAWYGMTETLRYCFDKLKLERLYWRVSNDNPRAIRFFEKHGFNTLDLDIPNDIRKRYTSDENVTWFAVWKGDEYDNELLSKGEVAKCKIVKIKTIPTIEAGELSFFEGNHDIDFDVKRIYYITKVPEGVRRGFHAHKSLKQLLFCPYGKIQLILENAETREEITLSDPSVGILIEKPTWREMLWIQKDSVLVVAASDYYTENDYIRSYEDFKKYVK